MVELYGTETCPRCDILEKKLVEAGIQFEKNGNMEELLDNGFKSVPVLKVNKDFMDYLGAISWIRTQ